MSNQGLVLEKAAFREVVGAAPLDVGVQIPGVRPGEEFLQETDPTPVTGVFNLEAPSAGYRWWIRVTANINGGWTGVNSAKVALMSLAEVEVATAYLVGTADWTDFSIYLKISGQPLAEATGYSGYILAQVEGALTPQFYWRNLHAVAFLLPVGEVP